MLSEPHSLYQASFMITKKSPEEIEVLREAGAILATMLERLSLEAVPGASTLDINDVALELCEEYGVEPILLGYHPTFAPMPYPAAICTSVNDVVQHGIPLEDEILEAGDVINIDMSIGYEGVVVDSGITVGVGKIDAKATALLEATHGALMAAIAVAKPGNHIGDISHAIETYVTARGFGPVASLCGHGVGYSIHEDPQIPNVGKAGTGPLIEVGHVYAIEPIVNEGSGEVIFDDEGDGYRVFSEDGTRSAHFEHTVVITPEGAEILTKKK
jgi:methionyl aminopeptidase